MKSGTWELVEKRLDYESNANGTVWTNTNNNSESNITFDLNGNIKTYTRRGLVTAPSIYGVIDILT